MKGPGATHERLVREDTIQGSSNRSFGLVFAAVFAIIGLWPFIGDGTVRVAMMPGTAQA